MPLVERSLGQIPLSGGFLRFLSQVRHGWDRSIAAPHIKIGRPLAVIWRQQGREKSGAPAP
jgi:hypothetical protein